MHLLQLLLLVLSCMITNLLIVFGISLSEILMMNFLKKLSFLASVLVLAICSHPCSNNVPGQPYLLSASPYERYASCRNGSTCASPDDRGRSSCSSWYCNCAACTQSTQDRPLHAYPMPCLTPPVCLFGSRRLPRPPIECPGKNAINNSSPHPGQTDIL